MPELVSPPPQDARNGPREDELRASRAPTTMSLDDLLGPDDPATEPQAVTTPDPLVTLEVIPPVSRREDPTRGPVLIGGFVAGLLAGTLALAPLTGSPILDPAARDRTFGDDGVAVGPTALVGPSVAEGFALLDRDPAAAAGRFRTALTVDPGDPTAALGLGTALVAQGDLGDATPWLCVASRAGGVLASSALGLLDAHRLSCPE